MNDATTARLEDFLRNLDQKVDEIQLTLARYEGKADAALDIRERLAALEALIKRPRLGLE
jgi:hypothetical protein